MCLVVNIVIMMWNYYHYTASESEYDDISKTTSNSGQVEGQLAGKDIGQPELINEGLIPIAYNKHI